MKKYILSFTFLLSVLSGTAFGALLINEFATNTSCDWVELTLTPPDTEMDISNLFVTAYYGESSIAPLARKPVTIRSYNLPETPYDDRYVVVHLTDPNGISETDDVGDLNGNGIRDIYCNNYSASLWNTSGLVAIDNDRDYRNGMIDCVAYSNMQEPFNSNVKNYVEAAASKEKWVIINGNAQASCVDIGKNGLASYMSVCRRSGAHTNSAADFFVSRFQTPGRDNLEVSLVPEKDIIKILSGKVFCKMDAQRQRAHVDVFISQSCNLRLRVFGVTGRLIYESPLHRKIDPGFFTMVWEGNSFRKNLPCGIYPAVIEATGNEIRGSVSRKFLFILGK